MNALIAFVMSLQAINAAEITTPNYQINYCESISQDEGMDRFKKETYCAMNTFDADWMVRCFSPNASFVEDVAPGRRHEESDGFVVSYYVDPGGDPVFEFLDDEKNGIWAPPISFEDYIGI